MKQVLAIVLCGLIAGTAGLLAQDASSVRAFDLVPLSGSGELDKALSDPRVGVTEKRLAIQRLGQLAGKLKGSQVPPSRLFNPLLGILAPQKNVRDHHLLREEACTALAAFSDVEGSDQLIAPLGKRLLDQSEREEVRMAAARTLSRFRKDRAAAAEQLVQALNQELERGPQPNNIALTTGIIGGLGSLGDKRSFVPLMRMVRSDFPNTTKRAAQGALENIRWE